MKTVNIAVFIASLLLGSFAIQTHAVSKRTTCRAKLTRKSALKLATTRTVEIDEFKLADQLGLEGRSDTFPSLGQYRVHLSTRGTFILGPDNETVIFLEFADKDKSISTKPQKVARIFSPHSKRQLLGKLNEIGANLLPGITNFIKRTANPDADEVGDLTIPDSITISVTNRREIGDRNRKADYAQLDQDRKSLETFPFAPLTLKQQHQEVTALIVGMAEYGILNSSNTYSSIGTFGVSTCIGVALYNSRTKSAAIAHIDAITNISQELNKIIHKLGEVSDLTAWLITSQLDARLMRKTLDYFNAKGIQINGVSKSDSEFSIDRNGTLYDSVGTGHSSGIVMPSIQGLLRKVN